jgi:osmoprotectant transport system substrate-binding protein
MNSTVVGSAGFPESKTVAETYAQALQANGFNVGRQMGSTLTMLDDIELELDKRPPGDLSILTPSPACDTDTVTVTADTADKPTSRGVADLNAAVSGNSGIDPDQAARNWLRDNGFDHPTRRCGVDQLP